MREITLATSATAPINASIQTWSGEQFRVLLAPSGISASLSISATPGGAPLVEIPSEDGGSEFLLSPNVLSPLTEGKDYWLNIWDSTDEADPVILVIGKFKMASTIQPSFVDYPTLVFQGATVVVLTQVDYDALVDPENDDVIYSIREA